MVSHYSPFTRLSGTQIFAKNLALELDKLGHDITMVYGVDRVLDRSFDIIRSIDRREISLVNIPYLRNVEFSSKCLGFCKNFLKKTHVDTLVSLGVSGIEYTFGLLRSLRPRPSFMYYAVDCRASEYQRKEITLKSRSLFRRIKFSLRRILYTRSDRLSCHYSDLVLASSGDTATALRTYYDIPPEKIRILYFGLPDNFAKGFEVSDPKTPTFLHIASEPERKGTIFFLKALKTLREKYDLKAKALVAGSRDPFYVNVGKNLDFDVTFVGLVPPSELKPLYATSTCLVSPSVSEGFCLPIVEAATFGKPAIVSEAGSLPELVKDGIDGYVVPVGDVDSLAERMYELATDSELRKRMSVKAKEKSKKFTISDTAKKFVNIVRGFKVSYD